MNAWETERAGKALSLLNETRHLGVNLTPYSSVDITVGADETRLRLDWNAEANEYRFELPYA